MALRFIMLGDIVGQVGRLAVQQQLPALRVRFAPDLIIANAENTDRGTGLTPKQYRKLCDAGVDGITLGDHVYKKVQIVSTLEQEDNIIRPANLSAKAAGKRWMKLTPGGNAADGDAPVDVAGGKPPLYVLTVLGRIFMNMPANDPFATVDAVLASLPQADPIVLVEVHAETTSEKIALANYLDGRVAAVMGTHTHVPTADTCILKDGTAFQCDLGMCGPHDSVLGRRTDRVLHHMTTAMPAPFDVADGDVRVNGVFVEVDEGTRRAIAVERFAVDAERDKPPFV